MEDHGPYLIFEGKEKRLMGFLKVWKLSVHPDKLLLEVLAKSNVVFGLSLEDNIFEEIWVFGKPLEYD